MFPDIKIQYHTQETETTGNDKKLQHPGIGSLRVFRAGLFEKEWFGAHPKGLYKEYDQQGQFIIRAVNTVCGFGFGNGTFKSLNDHEPVDRFIDHTSKSDYD